MTSPHDLLAFLPARGSRPSIRRLEIAHENPLYPTSAETLNLGSKRPLEPGVFELSAGVSERRWLIVDDGGVREVTEAQALLALGADRALVALGLGDASVSLLTGDVANARQQWLRHRDGL